MKLLTCLTFGLVLSAAWSDHGTAADTAATNTTAAAGAVTDGADETTAQKSETDARRALGRWWRFPWYDRNDDDIRPVLQEERKTVQAPNVSLLRVLAYGVIAAILAGLVWLCVSALLNYTGVASREIAVARVATDVDRVEALPFMRQRSLDDLLGQAREQYLAGNFAEAIIFLFSYELVELDRRNLIRLAVGKTNRQYLRELRGRGPLGGIVEQTMVAFEDVYFGGRRLGREQFASAWDRLPEFESLLTAFGTETPGASAGPTESRTVLSEISAGQS